VSTPAPEVNVTGPLGSGVYRATAIFARVVLAVCVAPQMYRPGRKLLWRSLIA
jgi:hypothetical protein